MLNSKGEIEFGGIDAKVAAESGLTEAPFLLSEGKITNPNTNDGYGLAHIEAKHGKEIRDAGYASVIDFIESVINNWQVIREGNVRDGKQTYRLIAVDSNNNTVMVELSGDGTYWNINTAGIFRTSYGKNKKEIYSRHATANQPTEAGEVSQGSEQSGTTEPSSMNTSTSGGKGTKTEANEQISGGENAGAGADARNERPYSHGNAAVATGGDPTAGGSPNGEIQGGEPAEKPAGYTIKPKEYTTKRGKRLDMHLVSFDRDFSPEELKAIDAKARAMNGWRDKGSGGFLMRSEEDARALAEEVLGKSEDELADEAPLSLEDLGRGLPEAPKAEELERAAAAADDAKADREADMARSESEQTSRGLEADKDGYEAERAERNAEVEPTEEMRQAERDAAGYGAADGTGRGRGENEDGGDGGEFEAPSGEKTPKDPKDPPAGGAAGENPRGAEKPAEKPVQKPRGRSKWVKDEDSAAFDALREQMRSLLGGDGPEGADAAHEPDAGYGAPKPMDPRLLSAGCQMTYLLLKGGVRRFADYAEAMVGELGDAIRPHLKSLYAATQMMEDVTSRGWHREMDGQETVLAFDAYNFDRQGPKDFIETAEHVSQERQSEQAAREIMEQKKQQRSQARKQADGREPLSPIGDEDYQAMARRQAEAIERKNEAERMVQIEDETRQLSLGLVMDDLGPDELLRGLNALQSMWEELASRYGEEPEDERAQRAMTIIENEMRRYRLREAAVAKERGMASAGEAARAEAESERGEDKPAEESDDDGIGRAADLFKRTSGQGAAQGEAEGAGAEQGGNPTDAVATGGDPTGRGKADEAAEGASPTAGDEKLGGLFGGAGESKENSGANAANGAGGHSKDGEIANVAKVAKVAKEAGHSGAGIQDWGEEIWGARKNALKEMAGRLENVGVADLVANPISKVFKAKDWAKMAAKGEIAADDAVVLEALSRLIQSERKPVVAGKRGMAKRMAERKVQSWAERTLRRMEALRAYCEATNKQERQAALRGLDARDLEEYERHSRNRDHLNPNMERGDLRPLTDLEVMTEVLKELGYPLTPIGGAKLPRVETDVYGRYYTVMVGDKVAKYAHSREEAVREAARIARVSRGDTDVDYAPEDFGVTARFTSPEGERTWSVQAIEKKTNKTVEARGLTRDEAKAKEAEMAASGLYGYVNAAQRAEKVYLPTVKDISTGERITIEDAPGFDSVDECRAWVADNIDDLQEKANALVSAEHGRKKGEKSEQHAQLEVWAGDDGTYAVMIRRGKGIHDLAIAVEGLPDRQSARRWIKENQEQVDSMERERKERMKNFAYFAPAEERRGADHRRGRDVSEAELGETFGFRGVQFGNWTNQRDRQQAVNEAYDALMDLAGVLGVSPRALSLGGELGLAFGARGTGKANAHYELDNVVINLTKTKGAGSLAHEWWHALDNYFSRRGGDRLGMMTDGSKAELRPEVAAAFSAVIKAVRGSAYEKRSNQRPGASYWGSMVEMTARLFAEWVDRNLELEMNKNSFLSSGVGAARVEAYRRRAYEAEREYVERVNGAISRRNAERKDGEPREPLLKMMSYEEFCKTEDALRGFAYPLREEIRDLFDAPLRALFEAMEEREEGDGGVIALNEPETEYGAGERKQRYETRDGESVNYTSEVEGGYGSLFDYDYSRNPKGERVGADGERAEVSPLEGDAEREAPGMGLDAKRGEFAKVERVFTTTGRFDFTAGERIESADDVAYIFKSLEDAAVEHSFVVLVKDGVPTVVELGMGQFNMTMVNLSAAFVAQQRVKADEVYFVHNHPSGELKCSEPDRRCLAEMQAALPGVPVHGVIINLKTGHYGTFYTNGPTVHGTRRTPQSEHPLAVHTMDKQIFSADYDPMSQPLVTGAADVAKFLNSHRMGDRAKLSVLVVSQTGRIIGNIHTPFTEIGGRADELARYISERVIQYGGMHAILYGDYPVRKERGDELRDLRGRMKSYGRVGLMDVVNVEGRRTSSAAEQGMLWEPDAGYGAGASEGGMRYREVEDEGVRREFAEGRVVKAYRTMQLIDGKLYSPMAAKVGGKETPQIKLGAMEQAEENPDMIKGTRTGADGREQGYVTIDKGQGKGTLRVAYNPYIHASRGVLNDQFTSAHTRPNLVIVEVEIPQSELTSGYRAEMAKDGVGEMSWHSGTVSGQLASQGKARRVILSRYDRPVRIVPHSEVAAMIAEQLRGTGIEIPYNVVTPQLRAELEKLGVPISERASGTVKEGAGYGRAEYVTDADIAAINGQHQRMSQTTMEAKRGQAEEMGRRLKTPIRIVEDAAELTHENKDVERRMRRAKGYYDPRTGEVVVVVGNHADAEDVAETVLHEVVAHRGLREMAGGEERYGQFCDEVYEHLTDDLKREIDEDTTRRFQRDPARGWGEARREAVDELFGRLAEKGFEDFTRAERGIWAKLKAKVLELINEFLGSLKLPKWVKLGDNELRYMLWRSHERLREGGDYVDRARDAAKRRELGLDDGTMRERRGGNRKKTASGKESADGRGSDSEAALKHLMPSEKPDAKIRINVEESKGRLQKLAETYKDRTDTRGFLGDLINGLGLTRGVGSSAYGAVDLPNGETIVVRISNHNVNSGNAGNNPVFSIVVKSRRSGNTFAGEEGKKVVEYVYFKEDVKRTKGMLSSIVESVSDLLTSGEYVDRTGKARENRSGDGGGGNLRYRGGETDDLWEAGSLDLDTRRLMAQLRLAQFQQGDAQVKADARRAVIDNLQKLVHDMRNKKGTTTKFAGADRKVEAQVTDAMNAQAVFDRTTVKRVTDLARVLIEQGYLPDLRDSEVKKLLAAARDATAMEDIGAQVEKIVDVMVDNQVRQSEWELGEAMKERGSRTDSRGVEVQGSLDIQGVKLMDAMKEGLDMREADLDDRIWDAQNRLSDPDPDVSADAALELTGLELAREYAERITDSKADEARMRQDLKDAKADLKAGRITRDAYNSIEDALREQMRKERIKRAQAAYDLAERVGGHVTESQERAKAFREAQAEHVREIQHNANSDMEGRPAMEHRKDSRLGKLMNSWAAQVLLAPLGTFDQMLRVFGNKSASGEGYLWNRFMRGWEESREKELRGVEAKHAALDAKAAELFGKGKSWGDLILGDGKLPKLEVEFMDGGEMRPHELTQGNLMYIYMVDKMTDGMVKLRRMGIDEAAMDRIKAALDPRYRALADWLQEEFLPQARKEYNATHERMFGASMAEIENYFPLKILANARVDTEDDLNGQGGQGGIMTKTGAIVKRRHNSLALDVTGANALSVILDHVAEMEHWNAYAEWNRDLNVLRTYKRFRNQVQNMTTAYGSGKKLWDKFNDLCLVVAGQYKPKRGAAETGAVNFAKGVTAAKVSFRVFTALKQLLSAPAYIPEVSAAAIAKSVANPYAAFKWSMENLPIFRERWRSRISGNPQLLKTEKDWSIWRNRVVEMAARVGMTPNAFVDAVTVAIGAKAIYETRLKQYLKEGYPADMAEKRAKQDATILFNQTQQSSESPFLSMMQVDHSWYNTLMTIFRNASMSYTRQTFDAARNLNRNLLTPGQRSKSVAFMAKQILRDWGVDPDGATADERAKAEKAASARYNRQIRKDLLRVGTFGYLLEWLWNLGPYAAYLIFGANDDEKRKMWKDAAVHALFGPIEGLTGGDAMSNMANAAVSGELEDFDKYVKNMPLSEDFLTIGRKFKASKYGEATTDIVYAV